MENDSDVLLAHRLADLAGELALGFFGRRLAARHKSDGSPVSDADLAVEQAMLAVLAAERPGDAVLSEECGALRTTSRRRWILDPIDGTIPFLAGARDWGTHVALEVDGALRAAVLSRPTEGVRWWAVQGRGAFASTDGQPLSAARPLRIPGAAVPLGEARVGGFLMPGSPVEPVRGRVRWVESSVCLVADLLEGWADAVVDEGGHVWDRAPAALLVREAGGRVDDLCGGSRLDGRWLVYAADGVADGLTGLLRDAGV
ncbi:inositol monophosphatase family protein [Streptomyces sp. TRM 70351]|uniref:inositol monophosphatase family protein n=1 Tax=Streptomyces sp. TRM 70351 TaxID=3116552 RepID=UPI002E7BC315|nr:inositol monophosphatase family protein [Streptomyces sp. TRM 70351]MEE1931237.1 inositol monophosphatase family protein [Streptomyces sp. TRM 70351]